MNWAAWTIVILAFVSLCLGIGLHGKPRDGHYNAGLSLFSYVVVMVLYWFAGLIK